jgi:hypothetical protein
VIQDIQLFQNTPYQFPTVEPIATFLTDFPYATEKELFELSLVREPRDADPSQIL